MSINATLLTAVFAVFASAPALAQQSTDTAETDVPPPEAPAAQVETPASPAAAADADAANAESKDQDARTDTEALLAAQAAGYKLKTKDGKQVFCKKEMVTGSRLATRTRCLTLAQMEAERNAVKDMLNDMSRRSVNIPEE